MPPHRTWHESELFNIYVDPHAAAVVFGSGLPITVLPLDVTYKVLSTPARIQSLKNLGNQAGKLIAAILVSHGRREIEKFSTEGGPLHDPCVIAYLLEPSLFAGRLVNVAIETQSDRKSFGSSNIATFDLGVHAFWSKRLISPAAVGQALPEPGLPGRPRQQDGLNRCHPKRAVP